MRKSMKTKILICIFILDLVMIIGVSIIAVNFRTAVKSANTMSDTYLMVEQDFGNANTNVQNLVKRFFVLQTMNYMYDGHFDNIEVRNQIIGLGEGEYGAVEEAIADLKTHVATINDKEFTEEYQIMSDAALGFVAEYKEIEKLYYNGDFAGASTRYFSGSHEMVTVYEENVALMTEKLEQLVQKNNALLEKAEKEVQKSIIIGIVLLVIASISAILIVIKSVNPLVSSAKELDKMINEMNTGNANLAHRLKIRSKDEVGV